LSAKSKLSLWYVVDFIKQKETFNSRKQDILGKFIKICNGNSLVGRIEIDINNSYLKKMAEMSLSIKLLGKE